MSEQSTLYDVPGPRARLITTVASIAAGALVAAGLYFLVYRPLDERGEFTMKKWGPLIDPGNEYFALLWARIWDGFQATLIAAAIAMVTSLALGTLLAVARIQLKSAAHRRYTGMAKPIALLLRALTIALNAITRFFIEVFRGIPVVITIVFAWLGLPALGVDLGDLLWYLVVGLVVYNTVVIAEILRSGMEGLPPGQREAAEAKGLNAGQTTRLILLPQAFRIMLPALISQLVVVLKDTSLGFIIGYEEVLRITTQVVQFLGNQIQMYVVIGVIYIMINYLLSRLAQYAQRRIARGRKTRGLKTPERPAAAVMAEAQAGGGTGGV